MTIILFVSATARRQDRVAPDRITTHILQYFNAKTLDVNIVNYVECCLCGRYTVFTAIFLLCCLRDWTNGDTTVTDFLHSAYFIIAHRIIPSIKKKLEGVPITFGLIKGGSL